MTDRQSQGPVHVLTNDVGELNRALLQLQKRIDEIKGLRGDISLLDETSVSDPVAIQGTTAKIYAGTGTPEGCVLADIGSIYLRRDGGSSTTLYVKETVNAGKTGWVAK